MKTWRQGTIGRLVLTDGRELYCKLLKYPLAKVFASIDPDSGIPEQELFSGFLALSVLKALQNIGRFELTDEERKSGRQFQANFQPGSAQITSITLAPGFGPGLAWELAGGGPYTIRDIEAKLLGLS